MKSSKTKRNLKVQRQMELPPSLMMHAADDDAHARLPSGVLFCFAVFFWNSSTADGGNVYFRACHAFLPFTFIHPGFVASFSNSVSLHPHFTAVM